MDRKQILVVDQDDAVLRTLESELSGDFQVLTASEGRRALHLTLTKRVAVAIVSQCLPDMDGLQLLHKMKHKMPELPVIFIAATPCEDLIISAFRAGAQDFFKKPLEPKLVAERVCESLVATGQVGQKDSSLRAVDRGEGLLATLWRRMRLSKPGNRFGKGTATPTRFSSAERAWEIGSGEVSEPSAQVPALRVHFFGEFRIIVGNAVYNTWPSKKGKAVFAYLAFHHNRRIYRDKLMDLLWPHASPGAARNCLNVAVHGVRQRLRHLLPDVELIQFKNECYFLNPEIEINVDVEDFLRYWRLAQSTERQSGIEAALGEYELAAALYTGDFMESDIYEDWTMLDRENLKEIYLVILDRLSRYYSNDGKPLTAINLCNTILSKDDCREDVHRRLMRCYYAMGHRDKALRQFHKCTEILRTELDVDPSPTTQRLYEQLKRGELKFRENVTGI